MSRVNASPKLPTSLDARNPLKRTWTLADEAEMRRGLRADISDMQVDVARMAEKVADLTYTVKLFIQHKESRQARQRVTTFRAAAAKANLRDDNNSCQYQSNSPPSHKRIRKMTEK
ncbi:Aste57867_10972 [Aphanomyces stellatus]|uniref:Aste57867_10972 protein n=1 Tax=Aphanomyces stellatus TaxID=120398 RepID=A0A485KTG3_9STRA|nr:hypothetical protein As57867_010931 [Aphanomyces stellatus]VFT87840.1 Aste57867_10972 [Aphanomyces stellatus]